ncbi:hypothetical protein TWF730_011370 [Orbilia blumenaviensis]|uniref:Uncharacterized protein n=1 Tax=Orbilia blumenaviensis TaxID=1796055 RepID=A0AAV9VFT5_9PEZI
MTILLPDTAADNDDDYNNNNTQEAGYSMRTSRYVVLKAVSGREWEQELHSTVPEGRGEKGKWKGKGKGKDPPTARFPNRSVRKKATFLCGRRTPPLNTHN